MRSYPMIKNKQYTFIVLILSIFLLYFLTTTVIYIIALNQGNLGISLGLFGGGDDGYFYFIQANNFDLL